VDCCPNGRQCTGSLEGVSKSITKTAWHDLHDAILHTILSGPAIHVVFGKYQHKVGWNFLLYESLGCSFGNSCPHVIVAIRNFSSYSLINGQKQQHHRQDSRHFKRSTIFSASQANHKTLNWVFAFASPGAVYTQTHHTWITTLWKWWGKCIWHQSCCVVKDNAIIGAEICCYESLNANLRLVLLTGVSM
jgi:hypothetical protein